MPQLSFRSFRLVCRPEQIPLVERLLLDEGFAFAPEPFFPRARRLVHEPLPLGSSLAALFGYIYIQDRSSMLPPLALRPPKGAAVLDLCASPGGKTGMLAQCVGETGFVLGNEPSPNRLATLRRNLLHLNSFCCATCSHPGERFPLPGPDDAPAQSPWPGWDRILLDPPCSGWGTAEKNPQVLRLWREERVRPLIVLQRRLLAEAARLLRPGGFLVYSTCTTNPAENEDQLAYARDELNLVFTPVPEPEGFAFLPPARPECAGALRVESGPDGQGFFVALLRKAGGRSPGMDQGPSSPDSSASIAVADANVPACSAPGESSGRKLFPRSRKTESPAARQGRQPSRPGRPDWRAAQDPLFLPRSCLAGPFTDPDFLPPGEIAVFNSVAHFLPAAALALLPDGFAWKGFPLGRAEGENFIRVNPHLRFLMPPAPAAEARGEPVLDLSAIAPLRALLGGQSLATDGKGPEIGLYYRGLPLCRLAVKGRRALLRSGRTRSGKR
jgi:16S rRNA (cytosine1407-C5)-methyltransferase